MENPNWRQTSHPAMRVNETGAIVKQKTQKSAATTLRFFQFTPPGENICLLLNDSRTIRMLKLNNLDND